MILLKRQIQRLFTIELCRQGIHDMRRLTLFNYERSNKTFIGETHFNEVSEEIEKFLKRAGYGYEKWSTPDPDAKYLENHNYFVVNDSISGKNREPGDNIIIDPSYRQCLLYRYIQGDNLYNKHLYEILDPIFVGPMEELGIIVDEIVELEYSIFSMSSLSGQKILSNWENNLRLV